MFDMSQVIEMVVTAVVLFSIIFLVWSSYTTSLLGKDFWVWLPFLGKMAKWSRGDERTGENNDSPETFIPVEKALYDYYKNGVPEITRKSFEQYRKYLVLAKQSDRKPMSGWMWVILFGLTVAEAFGTGALVAPLVSREITPDGALFIGSGVALVLAVITLFFTHNAGHDLYHNSLVSHVAANFRQRGGFMVGGQDKPVEAIGVISPDMDQDKDELNAPLTRLAARLGIIALGDAKKKYLSIVSATALILLSGRITCNDRSYRFHRHHDVRLIQTARAAFHDGCHAGGHHLPGESILHAKTRLQMPCCDHGCGPYAGWGQGLFDDTRMHDPQEMPLGKCGELGDDELGSGLQHAQRVVHRRLLQRGRQLDRLVHKNINQMGIGLCRWSDVGSRIATWHIIDQARPRTCRDGHQKHRHREQDRPQDILNHASPKTISDMMAFHFQSPNASRISCDRPPDPVAFRFSLAVVNADWKRSRSLRERFWLVTNDARSSLDGKDRVFSARTRICSSLHPDAS